MFIDYKGFKRLIPQCFEAYTPPLGHKSVSSHGHKNASSLGHKDALPYAFAFKNFDNDTLWNLT